jgi:glyoxylase-like metal-dependent hydrolase (beta-lactamase superfamily II)
MKSIIKTIDCKYLKNEFASAYLMIEKEEALFIDNNTNSAIPILLNSMKESNIKNEDIRYLIITHIHLDHAGATSSLIKLFPNATVLAHPKAAPHLISPKRIIEGATAVYGKDNFLKLYGEITEIPADRIRVINDGEIVKFGDRELKFIFTRGHANHHFVIHDSETNAIFTGDSFGISYPNMKESDNPFLIPSTTPTDFDALEAKISVQKILDTKADFAYLTHFDKWTNMQDGAEQLIEGIEKMEMIIQKLVSMNLDSEQQKVFTEKQISEFYKNKLNSKNISNQVLDFLREDIMINAMGINFTANRLKKKIA